MKSVPIEKHILFEWDKGNELKNWLKHKVANNEAEEAFYDERRLITEDTKHSTEEELRFILFGKTKQGRVLFIIFTIRDEKVRVISARDADRKEVEFYEKAINTTKI
jgi:uncharacterized protein